MKIDIDRLHRLAQAATPGPWKATHQKLSASIFIADHGGHRGARRAGSVAVEIF